MRRNWIILLLLVGFISCAKKEAHFISNDEYRTKIGKQFEETKVVAAARATALFSGMDTISDVKKREALEFLYASMPLSDLADYDGKFFYSHVDMSFKALQELPWGKQLPEDAFRHFVLPYRVNNENLDSFRMVMYEELKFRVAGMDMKQAAMEINHWCQEHVNYMGADSRTSSPLATVKNGRGRCGEESTLLVAALRTVGIPARQVYTPRWAHCDDNHAWVEIWADGSWYFTGACEPAPQLNQGWFVEPARRAMLIHTRTFGMYHGDEESLEQEERYSNLNVLGKYAKTKQIRVQVCDTTGKPVDGALISFGLYNYAEFYPLYQTISKITEPVSFTTGFGDLGVLTSFGSSFAFQRVPAADTGLITIQLNHFAGEELEELVDFIPPVPMTPLINDTVNTAFCSLKMSAGDSLRNLRKQEVRKLDDSEWIELIGNTDAGRWAKVMARSEANVQELVRFLRGAAQKGYQPDYLLLYLEQYNEKDLRDTPADVLMDHLLGIPADLPKTDLSIFLKYINHPRVYTEMLGKYRSYFAAVFSSSWMQEMKNHPEQLVAWVKDSIVTLDNRQQYNVLATPIGVCQLRRADAASKDVFLVALARSCGIAARLSESDLKPQLLVKGDWQTISVSSGSLEERKYGNLRLELQAGPVEMPIHRTHYSLGRYGEKGFETVEYDFDIPFSDLPQPYRLEPGYYRLITGNRVKDGKVLTKLSYFNLAAGEEKTLPLIIRSEDAGAEVLGSFDGNAELTEYSSSKSSKLQDLFNGKSLIVMYLSPSKEPSRHLIVETAASASALKNKELKILCLLATEAELSEVKKTFGKLGELVAYVKDDGSMLYQLNDQGKMNATVNDNPRLFLLNPEGKIGYFSSGYQINMLESLLQKAR